MEAEDIGRYCDLILEIEGQENRITVEAEGRQYSVRRYCPHQGGDLAQGWMEQGRFLVCPRHRWQFDLLRSGRCTTNAMSIDAICLDAKCEGAQENRAKAAGATDPADTGSSAMTNCGKPGPALDREVGTVVSRTPNVHRSSSVLPPGK
jgi:UDP-MurNAc hydroxylase